MKGVQSRKVAVEVLLKVELESAYANLALNAAFDKPPQLSERDRAFVTFIVQGVIRHEKELDAAISRFSKRPLAKVQPALKMVLRTAVFQLLYMKDVPQSAVLDTAAEVARATGHEGSASFVNGILRSFLRSGADKIAEPDQTDTTPEGLAQRFSMPEWLIARWSEEYGIEETIELLKFSQSVPPLVVRCCQVNMTPEGLTTVFENKGMKVRKGELVSDCLIIEDRGPVTGSIEKIPGYAEGLFTVQDEAASFVSLLLDPKSGQTIVDLCAAPGGKSLHIAEMMEGKGRVVAVDIREARINLLPAERRRVGLTNIETVCADGTEWRPDALADAVLLDAPCTGTGVINRRTDLRRKKQEPDLRALEELQRRLLTNAAKMVKPGGTLVYSTCSMEPEEGYAQMKWFLATHPEFRGESILPHFPETLLKKWSEKSWWPQTEAACKSGMLQLLPSRHGTSGFFVAKLKRAEQ